MHFCHILKTAPSLLLAQPLKTRRLSFNSALLSRARVYLLKSLSTEDIEQVLTQAMEAKPVAMVVRILFCQMKHDVPLQNW